MGEEARERAKGRGREQDGYAGRGRGDAKGLSGQKFFSAGEQLPPRSELCENVQPCSCPKQACARGQGWGPLTALISDHLLGGRKEQELKELKKSPPT